MYFDHCENPKELGEAISAVLAGTTFHTMDAAGPGPKTVLLVGPQEEPTLRNAFFEARSLAERWRKANPELPPVPDTLCYPLEGLRRMAEWCEKAEQLTRKLNREVRSHLSETSGETSQRANGMESMQVNLAKTIIERLDSLCRKPAEHTLLKQDEECGLFSTKIDGERFEFFARDGWLWDKAREPIGRLLKVGDDMEAELDRLLQYLRLNGFGEVARPLQEVWTDVKGKDVPVIYQEKDPGKNHLVRLQQELRCVLGYLNERSAAPLRPSGMAPASSVRGRAMTSSETGDWRSRLQPSEIQFLSRTAQEVALLVQDQKKMKQFRARLAEFAEHWTAYRIACEAEKAGKWQPEMGTPENPLGTIWPAAPVQQQPGVLCFPGYPKDVPVILGGYALLGTIHDRALPQCARINDGCLPDELEEEIWLNLVTGRLEESRAIDTPRRTIAQHRVSRSLDCVKANLQETDRVKASATYRKSQRPQRKSNGAGRIDTRWPKLQKEAESYLKEHPEAAPPSKREFARVLECHVGTLNKAIENSPLLQEWQRKADEWKKNKNRTRAGSAAGEAAVVSLANGLQPREDKVRSPEEEAEKRLLLEKSEEELWAELKKVFYKAAERQEKSGHGRAPTAAWAECEKELRAQNAGKQKLTEMIVLLGKEVADTYDTDPDAKFHPSRKL